jgi:hypothetical protein
MMRAIAKPYDTYGEIPPQSVSLLMCGQYGGNWSYFQSREQETLRALVAVRLQISTTGQQIRWQTAPEGSRKKEIEMKRKQYCLNCGEFLGEYDSYGEPEACNERDCQKELRKAHGEAREDARERALEDNFNRYR